MLLWVVATLSCWVLIVEVRSTTTTTTIGKAQVNNKRGIDYLRQQHQSSSKFGVAPNRPRRSTEQAITECMDMISTEGIYFHTATNVNETCAIYVVTKPDEKVEIRVSLLDVPCENGGMFSLLDGWELSGEIFPSLDDHPNPNARAFEVCGRRKIKDTFRTSQNAAMVLYRMPRRNTGFRFSIRFVKNPRPCNVLLQDTEATLTLRNYGMRSNCTIASLFPAEVRVVTLSVGVVSTAGRGVELETGTVHKVRLQCNKRGLDDYVQIGGSRGLDTSRLLLVDAVCGMDSKSSKRADIINCGVTVVRLVSSGAFDNSVTVSMRQLTPDEQESFGICLQMDETIE